MLYITALSAAILAMLGVLLTFKIVRIRRKEKISVGDGGNESLLRAIRAHSNLLEYAPIALILLGCAELNGVSRWLLAIIAIAFVAGRILHPVGLKDDTSSMASRVLGMQLTLVSIMALSIINILWLGWLLIT